ncbi:MAG: tape measure protein [Gloeotrichia echinulata GP01]
MGSLGSASIQLTLDRSQFDSDLKKLQATDAGQIAYRIKLDTKDFEQQVKGLSKLVTSVFIPLEIDTKTFDQQIKKLSTSIDPIKVDLAPNVKDFQEKLRRLSKISPIAVDVKVDESKVRQQFEQVGKYAAEGFTQGFSGVEGAGKSAIDSMVNSVNKQLGIQSPSKVFREIGKYAIAGLMQGLDSVDESKLKGVTNKIEGYFKKSKIKINVDIDASGISGKVKVQAPVSSEKPAAIAQNITKSIEDGFQKAKPKANFLGAIFGGLGSLITIPLAATLRGAFEGIGTPLGLQLGTGVTKAIQSTLGQNIGSLELISQKAVEKSLQAIPAAQSAIVEVIKGNPIGNAVVQQLELLQRTLELYSINLSPQKAVKSLATDEERAVASSSATFESQQSQFKSRKKAKAAASNEFVSIVDQKGEVDKISAIIKQKEQDLTAKAKKLASAQSTIASLQTKQEKLASLPAPKTQTEAKERLKTDTNLKKQIAEMSQALSGGSTSIEQDIKDIQSLKNAKRAYLEKLNKQIKILAELGIEKDLSGQTAEILKGIDVFEQLISAQKAVAEARKNVKTNANTPESIRPKKLQKLEGLATNARADLEKAISSPDASPEQVQKLKKRAAAANKALELYKLEISDPAKEIEKLNQKLANGNAVLAKNIQELQTRLNQAIPALFRDASQEVVKVGNLGEIAPQKPKSVVQQQQEFYSENAILQREQGKKKEQEIKRKIANSRSETDLPREYREIAKDVGQLYAGIKVKSRDIPGLKASGAQAQLGYSGLYDPIKNQVSVSNELFDRAKSGTLTPQDISTLTHEIIHAIDYGFGKRSQIDAASARNIKPTPEELKIEGARIEGSTRFEDAEKNHGQSRDLSRTLETNAYIGDLRLSPEVLRRSQKRQAIHNFETEFGRGAPLAVDQYKGMTNFVDERHALVKEDANSSGINIDKERESALAKQKAVLAQGFSDLKPLIEKARSSLEILPTEEIIALQESLRNTLASSMAAIEQEQAALQSELEKKKIAKSEVKISAVDLPSSTPKELGVDLKSSNDVNKFLRQNLNAKGMKDLARRMGIDTKNTNKEYLLNEITSLSGTADSRKQIGQLVSQLSPDKLLSSSKLKTNSSTDATKAIAELKKNRKALADALKIAQELDVKEREIVLKQIIENAREQEAIAKQLSSEHQLTPAHSKSLGGVKTQFKNISSSAKSSLAAIQVNEPKATGQGLGTNLVSAIGSGMSAAQGVPVKAVQSVMGSIQQAAEVKAEIKSPSRVFQRIGKFLAEGLSVGINQGRQSVQAAIKDLLGQTSVLSFDTISEVLTGTIDGLNAKLDKFKVTSQIVDDIQTDNEKKSAANTENTDPNKRDNQRNTIRQRAKLSAKLEREYGMEGFAPEILPERIQDSGKSAPSASMFQGIKDIFKSLDNSVAKRVKKRAARLAMEVDSAIAPSLETSAIAAQQRGDKVEQKQYQKLARQSRAATKSIARILETPGDLTDKQVKQLDRLTQQLERVYDAIGRPLPSQGFLESLGLETTGIIKNLGGAIKGFLAFSVGMWAQNFFGSVAQEAFKAFVELDRLKTALNFASGGTALGAQNLAFVRKTVDDLKVPLGASTEGFVQLAAAAKGSALEGRETRETFLGISQASTVLSLSADQTQGAILALSQMISKGKVSSEELRQQLGERLPGAMGIAARSMGLTEQEFTRLLDAGQILSQDFLPKFAKQLQSEFGDAAKDASGNAQSAIVGVQNAFLGLQQGIGEGVSPAAIAGLSGLSTILKGLAAVSKELGFILLGVTITLGVKMVGALQAVKLATGTLGGRMASLGQTINNSFSVKLTAGIFAVLEIINLLNQAINTELVSSFDKAAKAATGAAEASAKAFEKPSNNENQTTEPVASSGVGRFFDNFLIKPLNYLDEVGPIRGIKLDTYGKLEQDSINKSTNETTNSNTDFLISARTRLNQLKSGSGDIGQLPVIDATLKDAEQQRQILQADINRKFTAKGVATPVEDKRRLEAQNLRITDLNNQRSQIAKPFTLDLSRTQQQIDGIKSQIESLKSPEGIAAVGGDEAALQLIEQLKNSLERLKKFKAEAENTLASLRIDPVLAFTQSLRQLNLVLAEGQEKNDQKFNSKREAIATNQITGFSTNKLATRDASLQNAIAQRDRDRNNVIEQEKAINSQDAAINSPEFQTTLKRLGVAPDSTLAKIDDVLKNTQDDADKGILEKLKSAKELRNKLPESRTALAESQVKVQQQVQDNSLFDIEDRAATVRSKIQKSENQQIMTVRNAQNSRFITEEQASEKISRIQLLSTQRQKKTTDAQLQVLREYYAQGAVSAEEFAKRERDLTTEQTSLEKQEAENRLAVRQATLAQRIKELEFYNRKAEALTATKASDRTRTNKEKLLASGLTPVAQDQFALEQTKVDAVSASDRVNLIKDKIAQNKQLFKASLKDARDFATEQYALNQELASANLAVVDQKIAAEEKYREIVERNIQRIMQAEENRFKSLASQLDFQKAGLDLYNQSLERTGKLEESRYNLAKALTDAATAPLETKRDSANRALELSRKLKDDNLDPGVRSAVTSQLSQMGFGTNELDILAQRSQIEDEIAAKKLEGLKLEQEYQRKALQLDLQRQRIAAETAVYDAESARLSAAKSKLEAEGALRIAEIKKDPIAIESAKVGLEIARREIELGDKRLDNATKNLGIQDELTKNATMAQELNQRTAIDQQLATDKARKQGEGVDMAEAMVRPKSSDSAIDAEAMVRPKSSDSAIDAGGKRQGRRPGRIGESFVENGRMIKDGVDVTNFQFNANISRTQTTGMRGIPSNNLEEREIPRSSYSYSSYVGRSTSSSAKFPEFTHSPGENLFEAYQKYRDGLSLTPKKDSKKADMPPNDLVTGALNKAGIQVSDSGYSQFAESLKMANQGIEQRLDKLIDSMSLVANTPRSLTVQTPNPVDDAAKLMSDLSRGQVVGAGL